MLAVFKIPFRPRVPSPLPCRLNVSPLFCLDKVPSLFRERVPSLFRLKVSPFRLKVPSLRGPMLSSFRRCMLLVREGSSILTGSDRLVVSNVGSFSTSTHWWLRRVGKPTLHTSTTLTRVKNHLVRSQHLLLTSPSRPLSTMFGCSRSWCPLEIIFVRAQFPALKLL